MSIYLPKSITMRPKAVLLLVTFLISSDLLYSQECADGTACNFNSLAVTNIQCLYTGDQCDDGNDLTFSDTINSSCNCAGIEAISTNGCLDPLACNFSSTAVIDDDSCLYINGTCDDGNAQTVNDTVNDNCECEGLYQVTIQLFDSGFDGWNGSLLTITNSGDDTTLPSFDLSTGNFEMINTLLPPGCYEISCTDDANPEQVSYTLSIDDEIGQEDLYGIADDFQIFSVGGVSGCTDPQALNYESQATCATNDCYYCGIDGGCETNSDGFLAPEPCQEIEICGPGYYRLEGSSYSGYIPPGAPCVRIPLKSPPTDHFIRIWPDFGSVMELNYGGSNHLSNAINQPECYYVDINTCIVTKFDWTSDPRKLMVTMIDDFGIGWQGISYRIFDMTYDVVASGTLAQAQVGNGTDFGRDQWDLPDGCYQIEFYAESYFYPGLNYRLDYIDQEYIEGSLPSDPVSFSISSNLCVFGCTDDAAVNFNPLADTPCEGDNSCCRYVPENDICDSPITIVDGAENAWNSEFANDAIFKCDPNIGNDLWYEYTPNCNELITISGQSPQGFMVSVYSDLCPNPGDSPLVCSESNAHSLNQVTFSVTTGQHIYIQISSDNSISNFGSGTFKLDNNGCMGCTNPLAYNYDTGATFNDGSCNIPGECAGDISGNGCVTAQDLTFFLASFGDDCLNGDCNP